MQKMIRDYNDDSLNRLQESYKVKEIDLYFINELLMFELNIGNLNEDSKYSVYSLLMRAFSFDDIVGINQDLHKALFYAEKTKNIIENLPDANHADLFFELAHVYAKIGDIENSETSFNEHIYYNIKDSSYPLVIGINKYKPKISEFSNMPLYSFRSIHRHSISDLIKEELTLADPALFNDPFDTPLLSLIEQRKQKANEKSNYFIIPQFNAYKHVKVRCFVKDKIEENNMAFQNLLMWSHYADSHKGICIRYKFNHKKNEGDKEKHIFSNWYIVDYEENIDFKSSKYQEMKSLLATKNKCWEYENEVRLIHFDPECRNDFKQIPLKEIDSKVEAIFFGCKCPENDKKTIKEIFKNQKDIEFFEFNNNPKGLWSEIYKLKPEDEIRFQKLSSLSKATFRQ